MSGAPLTPDPRWAGVSRFPASAIAEGVACALGFEGPLLTLPTACAAGNYAVADALEILRSGAAQVMLAGGADAFSRSAFIGFSRLHAMSPDVCRPFDRERQGLLLGEGAAVLVLERAEHARARGRRPLAKVLGAAQSCDGYHITGPHPEGRGAARVMVGALADARLTTEDVDHINAHGTGTLHNDRVESLAIRTVFGERAAEIPVSSIKALTGHTMGAAGAIESVASVLALVHETVPPTWNFRTPDPECALDVVPNSPRRAALRTVLNNSYAFGGNNASILFGRGA
jgi:3-oxoacyl-[acyl-carrier-protein] synthase II